MRSTDVDTHTAIVYGEYKPSNWYVNSIATYGWSDYSEDKSVAGVGVKADYDVETFGLQAMTGYDMQFKGLQGIFIANNKSPICRINIFVTKRQRRFLC